MHAVVADHPLFTFDSMRVEAMRIIVNATLLVLVMTVAGCSPGTTRQEFTRADGETIRKNLAEFVAAFNARQIDRIVALYADNSVFMPPNAPLLRGPEPLKGFFGDMFARGASNLAMETESLAGHGPLAYQAGTYSLTYGAGGAGAGTRDRGKFLFVLRNTAGTWRTEYTIWTSDLPKPVTTPTQ